MERIILLKDLKFCWIQIWKVCWNQNNEQCKKFWYSSN